MTNAWDFLVGEWDVDMEVVPVGAPIGRRAIVKAYGFLDGTALLDEWHHFDAAGENIVFRGAGFRTYIAEQQEWYVVWVMAKTEGYTELRARVVDGEIKTTGRGRDGAGDLSERGRYFDITPNGFSFSLDRSYDAGKTWISPIVSLRATRRKASA
jgi:hypothetical protein